MQKNFYPFAAFSFTATRKKHVWLLLLGMFLMSSLYSQKPTGPASYLEAFELYGNDLPSQIFNDEMKPVPQQSQRSASSCVSIPGIPCDEGALDLLEFEFAPLGGLSTCSSVANSSTSDDCFNPGDIPPGVTFSTTNGQELVTLGQGFASAPSGVFGPLFFADDIVISFSVPTSYVEFDYLSLAGSGTVAVEVYDANASLICTESATLVAFATPQQVVIDAGSPISFIILNGFGQSIGDLIDNFGFSNSGCSTVCSASPDAVCAPLTVQLGINGTASISAESLDGGSTDPCEGTLTFGASQTSFDCTDLGNNPVSLTVTNENGSSDCIANVSVVDGVGLVDPWSANDIGMVTIGNEYSFEACGSIPGLYTVTGSGNNGISTTTDNVAFASQTLCGDGMITAKIESVGPSGYGGLMIREMAAAGSKQAAIFSNLTNVLRHESRAFTNAPKQVQAFYKPNPFWLRLQRQGDWVFAYYSTTGSNFQYIHAVQVSMQTCVEIGLASFTNLPNTQTEAVFSNVSVTNGIGLEDPGNLPTAELSNPLPVEAQLFPNPANSQFTLRFSQGLQEEATASLRNQVGQVLQQRQLQPGDRDTEWNISQLPAGLYFMEVRQEGQAPQLLRVMKQ